MTLAMPVRAPVRDAARSPIRMLFVAQWFEPEPGALAGLPLARWMKQRGHDVRVLTGFPNYPSGRIYPGYRQRLWHRELVEDIPVARVPLWPSHDSTIRGRLANFGSFALSAATLGPLMERRADVAFVYHPPPTVGLAALVLKALRGIPYVYHIADMWPETVVETGALGNGVARRVVERAIHAWCNLMYRHAAAITVLSPGFKRLLVERGVPAEKVHVIYNWCDETVFRPVPRDEALARELGLAGKFNVIYAGNVGIYQGIDTLVRAAALLRDLPDVQVVIAGGGQRAAEVKALAESMGLDNVRFLPHRPFRDMPRINALAEALVVHLRDLDFFASTIPSKTQVSLASARPVLMAVRGDASDVVRASEGGVVVPPEDPQAMADAIRALHAMPPAQREAMATRGRAFYLENMSLDSGAAAMESLLQAHARVRA